MLIDEQHSKRLHAGVSHVLTCTHVERLHADVAGQVGDALEPAADHDERIERLEGQLVLAEQDDEVAIQLALEQIHGLLDFNGRAGQVRVLIHKRLGRVAQHRYGKVGNFLEAIDGKLHGQIQQLKRLPSDALSAITHALQFEIDLDGGIGEAQEAGHRLLADDELQAKAVHFPFQFVNILVAQDDRIGGLAIAAGQGLDAVPKGLFAEHGHFGEFAADAVNLTLQ